MGDAPATVVAKLQDMAEAASGGLLLLTDAGALAADAPAARALAAALAPLPPRAGVVLAGLPDELAALLTTTPGLAAAFPPPVLLPPPDAAQVAAEVASRAEALQLRPPAGLAARLAPRVQARLAAGAGGAGSAAARGDELAEQLLQEAVGSLARRAAAAAEQVVGAAAVPPLALRDEDFGL